MSITGALLGFAVASIIVGAIGAIVTGIDWLVVYKWEDNSKSAKYLALFVVLFFIGASIAGGVG